MALGLWQALPTAQDATTGGIRSVWVIPRKWVYAWLHEFTEGGRYGRIVGAEFGRRSWSILTRYPAQGTLQMTEEAKNGAAYTYRTQLAVTVNRASLERLDWLEALSQGQDVALMVQLLDNQILLMGEEPGCRITVTMDSGTKGSGTRLTITATHVTRAPLRVVDFDVANEWVTEDLCDSTMRAFCRLSLDDWCVPSITEICPPVNGQGGALAIRLIPGPQGEPGAPSTVPGPQGLPGPPGQQGPIGVGFVRYMASGQEVSIQPVNSRSSTFHNANDVLIAIPFRVDHDVTVSGMRWRTSGTTTDPLATVQAAIYDDDFATLGYIYPKSELRKTPLEICNPAGVKTGSFANLDLVAGATYWAVYQSFNGAGGTLISHASTGYKSISGNVAGTNDNYSLRLTGQATQTMPATFPSGAVPYAPGNQPLLLALIVA